jgi:hypothetical protein
MLCVSIQGAIPDPPAPSQKISLVNGNSFQHVPEACFGFLIFGVIHLEICGDSGPVEFLIKRV